jgi:hypothetical protein
MKIIALFLLTFLSFSIGFAADPAPKSAKASKVPWFCGFSRTNDKNRYTFRNRTPEFTAQIAKSSFDLVPLNEEVHQILNATKEDSLVCIKGTAVYDSTGPGRADLNFYVYAIKADTDSTADLQ